jgi:conjugal transfer pilin signal peptidase TrbI
MRYLSNFVNAYFRLLKTQWLKGLCCFLITLGMTSLASRYVNIVYSHTDSVPYRLFLQVKHLKPGRGDYTCLASPWYGRPMIKKVAGIAGDKLAYDKEGNLWVNALWRGRALKVGKQKKIARDGRRLTPIKPGAIPAGKVFVVGDHEHSFDSRYAELGLIPEADLQGRLLALI